MRIGTHVLAVAALSLLTAANADSQLPAQHQNLTYADLADLSVRAPVVAHVRLKRGSVLKPKEAGDVPPGHARFYVEADVVSLIRGAGGLPAEVSYLADVPLVGGKAPKLRKKTEYIVLAATVPGRPSELRLVAPDAQLAFTPQRAEVLRDILREAVAADAPPQITGIGKSFHVPGAIPGESETQIFLQTADARPVSLNILRRPGQRPQWAVALSEVVDDAAEPPQPNSLLWYRLACTLPRNLPPQSYADTPEMAPGINADYRFVLDQLGPCARSRG